ncbi:MAG: hypothetical protein JXA99_04875 [Candidatus Lokiarchaeota archaeon]|nr:hypothetical protein [Candidatus Lokiarchaeota archaeon]
MNTQNHIFSEILENLAFIFNNSDIKYSLIPIKSNKNLIYEIKLSSKVNNTSDEYIIKKLQKESATIEYNVIKRVKKQNIKVPSILHYKNPIIIQEKIKGPNLCDYINTPLIGKNDFTKVRKKDKDRLYEIIKQLAKWLATFHNKNIVSSENDEKIIVLNKGDTRLKNFILNEADNMIYGIDFEESYEGNYIDDIAWICCSLIDTNPGVFEMECPLHKIELLNLFLREYFIINHNFKFSFENFTQTLIENLNKVIIRRGLGFGFLNKNTFLNKIIKEI